MSPEFPRCCLIVGVGASLRGRHLPHTPLRLTVDACEAAVTDSGLALGDVDGLASYPGGNPTLFDVKEELGLHLNWFSSGAEGPAQLGPFINACMAVATGEARAVLLYRTVQMFAGGSHELPTEGLTGALEWQRPYGALAAANWFALRAAQFLHERQLDREDLAWIALTARDNAAGNPTAIYRQPMDLGQYLSARMISTPLCLYDCDVPCSGSVAFVITADAGMARGARAVRVEALSGPSYGPVGLDQYERMALWEASARLWQRTRLRPQDCGVAQLYDGFSSITLEWLEALGFCREGRVGELLEGGAAIARSGRIPLNTGGGMLSAGRIHGYLQLEEACIQLRRDGGDRQVPGEPGVAVVGVGGGPVAGAVLLSRAW